MNRICETCWYWQCVDEGAKIGVCKRFPPAPVSEFICIFPTTSSKDWCGEWYGYPTQYFGYANRP